MLKRQSFLFLIKMFLGISLFMGCSSARQNICSLRREHADWDLAHFNYNTPCEHLTLTLDEIISIALKNDLDLYVRKQRIRVQREIASAEALTLLPDLNLEMELSHRDNTPASYSRTLGQKDPDPITYGTSSEKTTFRGSIGLLWNVLDFGISYFRSRQECDRIKLLTYEYERAKQNLILQIVRTYWRAATSKFAIKTAIPLIEELKEYRDYLKKQISDDIYLKATSAYANLARFYQREIQLRGFNDRTDSSDPTQGYEKEYENAILDLASFMGMRPGTTFDIVVDEDFPYNVTLPKVDSLEDVALMWRPELYQNDVQAFITQDEVKIALLQQFPTLRFFDTQFFDRNKYLLHNSWLIAGVDLAWNLLSIPYYRALQNVAIQQIELVRRDRLLLSMGILVQVNLARILYDQNKEQYLLSANNAIAQDKLSKIIALQAHLGKQSEFDGLNARIDAVLAKVNSMKVYGELQNSIETINNAIGFPRYYKTEGTSKIDE
jgi:outer membrane protein TolC